MPANGEDRIKPPTPMPSPCLDRCSRSSHGYYRSTPADAPYHPGNNNNGGAGSVAYVPRRLRGSDISLTTITEEPPSWTSSHEIVVQPEVVVETTTCNGSASCSRHEVLRDLTDFSSVKERGFNCRALFSQECSGNSTSSSSSSGSGSTPPPVPPTASASSVAGHSRQLFTTKVTATAKVKVEVHAPIAHSEPAYYKHYKQRRSRDGSH